MMGDPPWADGPLWVYTTEREDMLDHIADLEGQLAQAHRWAAAWKQAAKRQRLRLRCVAKIGVGFLRKHHKNESELATMRERIEDLENDNWPYEWEVATRLKQERDEARAALRTLKPELGVAEDQCD